MRHFVTIGISPEGEVEVLCTDNDPLAHRDVITKLAEKGGKKSQRTRFASAYTLTTDHYSARRNFHFDSTSESNALSSAQAAADVPPSDAPQQPGHPETPDNPGADLPSRDLSPDKPVSKQKGARK